MSPSAPSSAGAGRPDLRRYPTHGRRGTRARGSPARGAPGGGHGRGRPPAHADRAQAPAFLVNFPFSYSTEVANNIWMQELEETKRRPDLQQAMTQFLDLYRFLAAEGLVYVLPTPRIEGLQDLVFTANLGIVLTHLDPAPVVVSNFISEPRRGEPEVGEPFFRVDGLPRPLLAAPVRGGGRPQAPPRQRLRRGYGLRSELEAYEWMEREFDMRIVKVRRDRPPPLPPRLLDLPAHPGGHAGVYGDVRARGGRAARAAHERDRRRRRRVLLRHLQLGAAREHYPQRLATAPAARGDR